MIRRFMKKKTCFLFVLIVLCGAVVIHSCKQTTDISEQPSYVHGEFEISSVKKSYSETMEKPVPYRTQDDKAWKTTKRTMNWKDSYVVKTDEGEKLIVPFRLEEEIFFEEHGGYRPSYSSSTFFIVSKEKGSYTFETATYITDYPGDSLKQTENWTGKVIVEDAQGQFVKAFQYRDGKIESWGTKSKSAARTMYQTCWYLSQWSCSYIAAIDTYFPCLFMYGESVCFESVPYGGTGGGSSGGGTYGTVGGITSNPNGIAYTTTDRLSNLMKLGSNLTTNQKIWVNEVLDEIAKTCSGKALYANLASAGKFEWKMDPTLSTPGHYDPVLRRLVLKDQSSLNVIVIAEELFHAYQDLAYPNGTDNYTNNGRINIEFEAKVWRDLMILSMSGPTGTGPSCCSTVNNVQEINYLNWLLSISDNGTKGPGNYGGIVSSQWYYYMGEFDNSWPIYPGSIDANLNPQAMFKLFNSSPCVKKTF